MKLSTQMLKELNVQINEELASSYLYLSMVAYFESNNFGGFAQWMKKQSQEEVEHAMKLFDYINERGGTVELDALKKPAKNWKSPLVAFQAALKHEEYITERIHKLVDLAVKEKDHSTNVMLHWFVTEQVEEEDNVGKVVEQLKMVGESKQGLLMLDHALGSRK